MKAAGRCVFSEQLVFEVLGFLSEILAFYRSEEMI